MLYTSKCHQVFPEEWKDIPYRSIFLTAQHLLKQDIPVVINAALYSNELVSESTRTCQGFKSN